MSSTPCFTSTRREVIATEVAGRSSAMRAGLSTVKVSGVGASLGQAEGQLHLVSGAWPSPRCFPVDWWTAPVQPGRTRPARPESGPVPRRCARSAARLILARRPGRRAEQRLSRHGRLAHRLGEDRGQWRRSALGRRLAQRPPSAPLPRRRSTASNIDFRRGGGSALVAADAAGLRRRRPDRRRASGDSRAGMRTWSFLRRRLICLRRRRCRASAIRRSLIGALHHR